MRLRLVIAPARLAAAFVDGAFSCGVVLQWIHAATSNQQTYARERLAHHAHVADVREMHRVRRQATSFSAGAVPNTSP